MLRNSVLLMVGLTMVLSTGCEPGDGDGNPFADIPALTEAAQEELAEIEGEGAYPWSGQSVTVVGSYHAVQDYAETASISLGISGGQVKFSFSPNPPWSDYRVSSWNAQGSLVVMRNEGGQWKKYWGDYFERDRYSRSVDEINDHMGGGRPGSGETVWMCACDGDRARRGTQRTNWVQVQWP